ncbi:S-layer homology domain-containing protein [Paenibacillus sp. HJL G12]|uniref:S-layer homology domain-containing protein n=1 Tax=Paenibacillus dendrobii TaxID=2691084 RepID=A0A7X3IJD2_9BACL|nr:S-layer homology domain-containing protein [Paenibacillus dendrobii]MWV43097.1 S-layer homology domain-containing protein [Paenibacillus dendrobii]
MTQQNTLQSEDAVYKKKLFYDNGMKFTEVKAKLITEYKPPTPSLKTHVNQTLASSAGLVQNGTSHYNATLTMLFYSKKEYADWLQYIGSQHKYFDEKGTVYIGIITGEPDVKTAEMETKYIVTIGLSLVRKQEFEYRYKTRFIDIDAHWAEDYIIEMQQLGLIATNWTGDGEEVDYFRPDDPVTRAESVTLLMRTYRYVDKLLRGY